MRPAGRGGHPRGGAHRGGHRPGNRPFGGGRGVLSADEIRLLFLSLIAAEARHGYELIRAIKQRTRGAYAPSPGVVYPALAALEERGEIAALPDADGRKAFAITPAGEAELAARSDSLAAVSARLSVLAEVDREQHAPIRRAMDNLKMVLANAVARPETLRPHDIAALIDEAAQKIERLN